jgi:hypothetical protein
MVKKTKKEEIVENNNSLEQVLIKKAMGYSVKETVDEFAFNDDEFKLIKRKETIKYYPPDLSAIELLMQNKNENNNLNNLTDEELEKEKQILIKRLNLTN